LIKACVEHHVPVTVAFGPVTRDGRGDPLVHPLVTPVFTEDPARPELVLAALRRANADCRFAAVLSTDEFCQVAVGVLGVHLGARAISPETALRFRDKALQKRIVADAGIRVAGSTVIDDIRAIPHTLEIPKPFGVVKPVAGAGTTATVIVRDRSELDHYAAGQCRAEPAQRTYLLEEFVEGEEWVADGLVIDGELEFLALSRYQATCLSTVNNGRPLCEWSFDPTTDADVYALATPTVRCVLQALGLVQGVFHMELFHEADTESVVLGECASRRGGALTHEMVLAKFAVDLATEALLAGLGRGRKIAPTIRQSFVGMTYLPCPPGILLDAPVAEELAEFPGVLHAQIDTPIGATVSGLANTSARLGAVLIAAASTEDFLQRVDNVLKWTVDRTTVAPPDATRRELADLGRRVVRC